MAVLLVTGGMGFIGSHFIRFWHNRHPQDSLINLDLLTYAGNPYNLTDLQNSPRYRFIRGDIADAPFLERLMGGTSIDAVVHFAAESHVDRSIREPAAFVRTNVLGTQQLLEAARREGVPKFVHVSTDEVYGTLGTSGVFTEETPLAPNSPYSASKAGSDLLARAYYETYGYPVAVTRCSNNYGPMQFPEKLIPTLIIRALLDLPLPLYGDGEHVRDWLHVGDHCAAIAAVLESGRPGEVYNVGGGSERTNLEVARTVLKALGKPDTLISFAPDRPGHDRRYAIDASKLTGELGWKPAYTFEEGLRSTVDWYVRNRTWWERILSGEYRGHHLLKGGDPA
ncbi:dTDP-glucose 4,6-dehydratase [Paenibacillus chitinolyticus]|uniref:dTDP-glucose 4,6-dehydratase n=1 Tax=Paenibacillus chitinolyticus TaxID=79263 RepID=UPI001C490770|nr:dTDP-glucose 4,6-dehydratase [Paenibacillus chitinolyticus]MBV6712238.1 dTDP-glucose 4,6-dehydratase [Paenibacillus chitinolyticus]